MNQSLQKTLYQFTRKTDINEVAAEELEDLVNKYPYSAIPHILLAKKWHQSGDSRFVAQAQRAALYTDPLWLNYLLAEEMASPDEVTPASPSAVPEIADDDAANPGNATDQQSEPAGSDDDLQVLPDQFHPEPEVIQEEIESGEEIPAPAAEPSSTTEDDAESAEPDDVPAEVPKPVSVSEEELAKDEQLLQKIASHEDVPEQVVLPASAELEKQVAEGIEHLDHFSKDIEARTHALVNPHEAAAGEIPFEPYHTIDYFASQGIQLVLENDPQDKLGKQLKKFTQWLKHMKRLGPEDALEAVKDTQLESTIQHIADSSNTPRDIVTETMAEVLLKQGKTDQAIQLYDKLSLLNPGKSAYFAAKIQTLKGS